MLADHTADAKNLIASFPSLTRIWSCQKQRHGLSLLLLLLHDLLDNLLLLNEKGAGDSVLDAVGATAATVCTLHRLLRPRDGGVLSWAEGWDLYLLR